MGKRERSRVKRVMLFLVYLCVELWVLEHVLFTYSKNKLTSVEREHGIQTEKKLIPQHTKVGNKELTQ